MPNLMPDWADWIRPAGRLIWSVIAAGVGISFLVALILPPMLKRPFPNWVGYTAFPAILVIGAIAAKAIPDVQTIIVWLTGLALVGHGLLMVASRAPRERGEPATWAESIAGATAVLAMLLICYAILPHEFLTFANSHLEWGDSTRFVWHSGDQMLFFPWDWPFSFDFPALRDVVVSGIYAVLLGANLKLWIMWQHRLEPKAAPEGGDEPTRRSHFGRPLRAWGIRRAEAESVTASSATSGSTMPAPEPGGA